jgi:integrase
MPFKNGSLWWTRVPRSDGRSVRVSTGTANKTTARAIESMVASLKARADFPLLDSVADGETALLTLYSAFCGDSGPSDVKASLDDVDLSPLVATWRATLERRQIRSADKYVAQVRELIPAGAVYPRSNFRRKNISEFLNGLEVTGSTRNRYKAALRQFGAWLVETEQLEHNPVVDVKGAKENASKIIWHDPTELKLLLGALEPPYRAFEAIMVACGMETQAVIGLRRRDVDLTAMTIRAHGHKNAWRNRVDRITEGWVVGIIAEYVKAFSPNALLFEGLDPYTPVREHVAACEAVGIQRSTIHDHRHSYAVNALKRGVPLHVVAHQLGHKDTTLVQRTYGKFVPSADDFDKWTAAVPETILSERSVAHRRSRGTKKRLRVS